MIPRRRNTMPPLEVMGQNLTRPEAVRASPGKPAAPKPVSPPEPAVMHKAPTDAPPPTGPQAILARSQQPMVLRVPQGLLVISGLVVIGLIVLAYMVGSSRGYNKAETDLALGDQSRRAEFDAQRSNLRPAGTQGIDPNRPAVSRPPPVGLPPVPPGLSTGSRSAGTGTSGGTPQKSDVDTGVKPSGTASASRQVGYNYFVLATSNHDETQRLAQFLRENGVDAGVFPQHNGGSFQVVALRGFPRDQLTSQSRKDYERELRRLGRLWKTQKSGSSDLADMYPDLYHGEPAASGSSTKRKTP